MITRTYETVLRQAIRDPTNSIAVFTAPGLRSGETSVCQLSRCGGDAKGSDMDLNIRLQLGALKAKAVLLLPFNGMTSVSSGMWGWNASVIGMTADPVWASFRAYLSVVARLCYGIWPLEGGQTDQCLSPNGYFSCAEVGQVFHSGPRGPNRRPDVIGIG
jgi:hypothetical protein